MVQAWKGKFGVAVLLVVGVLLCDGVAGIGQCESVELRNVSMSPSVAAPGAHVTVSFEYRGTGPGRPHEHLWVATVPDGENIDFIIRTSTPCQWHSENLSFDAPTVPGSYTYYLNGYGASQVNVRLCTGPSDDRKPFTFTVSEAAPPPPAQPSAAGEASDGGTYLLRLNSATGEMSVDRVNPDGAVGASVQEATWSTGWTSAEFFTVGGQTYLFRLKSTTGEVSVDRVNADGSIGDTIQSATWSKGWTVVEAFPAAGQMFMFFLKSESGQMSVNRINSDGTIGFSVQNRMWSSGWTVAEAFTVRLDTYMFFLKTANGQMSIDRVNPDGTFGAAVYSATWSSDWTFAQILQRPRDGQPLLFLLKSGTGQMHMDEISSDGTIGSSVQRATWSPGWTSVEFFTVGGETYLFRLKSSTGEMGVDRVDPDGTIGDSVQTATWAPGWTTARFFTVEVPGALPDGDAAPETGAAAELSYDDGTAETTRAWSSPGKGYAVRFTPPANGGHLVEARFYIHGIGPGGPGPIEVRVWDADRNLVNVPVVVTPTQPGWLSVELVFRSAYVPTGDFYVGYVQLAADEFPWIGLDTSGGEGRSYTVPDWSAVLPHGANLMIRAVFSSSRAAAPVLGAQGVMDRPA